MSDGGHIEPGTDRVTVLWRRLKDHRNAQWTVGYVALAYGIQHAVTLTSEAFKWPDSIIRISMLLLALGLPVAMTLAWYHGVRVSRRISAGEMAIVSLLLVLISFAFYATVRPAPEFAARAPVAQEASVTAARAAAASPKGAISVAVLPFLNLSSDKEQEFFSDGMTEEITTALAKVPDLRVVGRTSAFQFKGTNKDLRSIGQSLSATHLIEGSVRKAGNRVRITAQLIKADDGTHIWAEDYDRDLTDVFAIQEDIARAITASLHMTLGLRPGENLVNNRSIDPESHDKFLRAVALIHGRGGASDYSEAQKLLLDVATKNPRYSPCFVWLSASYFFLGIASTVDITEEVSAVRVRGNENRVRGEEAAKRALELDPNEAGSYNMLAIFAWTRAQPLQAEQLFNKALSLDPENANVLDGYGIRIGAAGRIQEALPVLQRARSLEPFLPQSLQRASTFLWLMGENDEAITVAKQLRPALGAPLLSMFYASMARFNEAADALKEMATAEKAYAAEAAQLLHRVASNQSIAGPLPSLPRELQFVYLYTRSPEQALDNLQRAADSEYVEGFYGDFVWHPSYAVVRKSQKFKAIVRKLGFVEYWRAKGWPPQCHPTTGDDFECS